MAEEKVRRGLMLKTALEILRDAGTKLSRSHVMEVVARTLDLTPYEWTADKSGLPRYDTALGFMIGDAATLGWSSKLGGWSVTDAGIEALETYPDADELFSELRRRYREIDQRRKQAMQSLNDVQAFIASTLQMVEPGSWTAHDDLAELADTTPNEVADFLASGKVKLPTSYRVLHADGSMPAEGMLNASYRGTDLRRRLAAEGIEFDTDGRASQDQRLTAGELKYLLAERAAETEEETPAITRRAWMVGGTSVDGYNLVPQWLTEGHVSLSATQLGNLDPRASYDDLKQQVEAAYQHKSYAYRGQRLEEFDRFIRRMSEGDLVLTPMQGMVYLGEVASSVYFDKSASVDNLRRDVRWYNTEEPVDGSELRAPVPALLQSQAYVVDLTEAYDQLAALVPRRDEETPPSVRITEKRQRTLSLSPVTAELARDLLMDAAELEKIAGLLWERRQIIFYGPPGTGKTYLATRLARHLTEDGAVKIVQFHPSYTYEDFFEGFWPSPGGDGSLTFTLRAGPSATSRRWPRRTRPRRTS